MNRRRGYGGAREDWPSHAPAACAEALAFAAPAPAATLFGSDLTLGARP
jgi:hypothetical protein